MSKLCNNICDKIARLVYLIKRDDNVECVYMIPYSYNNKLEVIDFKIVYKTGKVNSRLLNMLYSEYPNDIDNGVKFDYSIEESSLYNNMLDASHVLNEAENDLYNATILYSRSKKYFILKKWIDNKVLEYNSMNLDNYDNKVELDLPLYNLNRK